MQAQSWERVDEVVADALELEHSARETYARAQLADEPEALAEALRLLARQPQATQFFARSPLAAWSSLERGSRLGGWELVEPLGAGGMGVVWKARRAEGTVEMFAAIKVLPAYFAERGQQFLRRFEAEKRILTRLHHPNIARMLDVSAGAGNVPNYVMEYVPGTPLGTFIQSNATRTQRLRLFVKICEAVQHAHNLLVVHRDLKPGNILVGDDGEPKLLDFGIARILDEESTGHTLHRIYSVDYASPEQILGEPTQTASDIYSLGLVLYELITGRRAREWSEKSMAECVEAISKERLQANALLDGNALAVVRKATSLRPEDRYRSAGEFAEDVERLIRGAPVKARPASVWRDVAYGAWRFRWALGAVALGVTALAYTGAWGLNEAKRARAQESLALAQARELRAMVAREQQALQQAQAQRNMAENLSSLAQARSREAEARSRDALRLAERTIAATRLQVSKLAGGTEASVRILEFLIRDLGEIAPGARSAEWYRLSAMAYRDLAELQGGPNSNLGDRDKRGASLRKSLEEWNRARRLAPQDHRLQLGQLTTEFSLNLHEKVAIDWVAMEKRYLKLARSHPRDYESLRAVGSFYFLRGAKATKEARTADYQASLLWFQRASAMNASRPESKRDQALLHKYLANNVAQIEQEHHAREAVRLDRERVAMDPSHAAARLDLAFSINALADVLRRLNQGAAALENYTEAYNIRKQIAAADPKNALAVRSLSYPSGWGITMSIRLGRWEALRAWMSELRWQQNTLSLAPPAQQSAAELALQVLEGNATEACRKLRNSGWLTDERSDLSQRCASN